MDKPFKIGLVLGVFAVAIALFQGAQNGRHQYSNNGSQVIVDTRTGEFWTPDGSHFEPRWARITAHSPSVDDETGRDDRANALNACLVSGSDPKKCLAEFRASRETKPAPVSAPQVPGQ